MYVSVSQASLSQPVSLSPVSSGTPKIHFCCSGAFRFWKIENSQKDHPVEAFGSPANRPAWCSISTPLFSSFTSESKWQTFTGLCSVPNAHLGYIGAKETLVYILTSKKVMNLFGKERYTEKNTKWIRLPTDPFSYFYRYRNYVLIHKIHCYNIGQNLTPINDTYKIAF